MNSSRDVYAYKILGEDRLNCMRRLVGSLGFPKSANSIGIKLNLCDYRKPETGAVSHPQVVGALLHVLRDHYPDAKIDLLEGDSCDTICRMMYGFLGMDEVARKYNTNCISLADCEWASVPISGGTVPEIEVPTLMKEYDLLINHPKLKTHGKTKMTASLKNLFGCYRPKDKRPYHRDLSGAIVDINKAIFPHFSVIDADLCVEGNRGPAQGFPKKVGLFIGGKDPVATDAFCATLMGFRPSMIKHIKLAQRESLGQMNFNLCGDLNTADLPQYKFKFSTANFLMMEVARKTLA
jgi:uncharacterized protein (DUF362 family)